MLITNDEIEVMIAIDKLESHDYILYDCGEEAFYKAVRWITRLKHDLLVERKWA